MIGGSAIIIIVFLRLDAIEIRPCFRGLLFAAGENQTLFSGRSVNVAIETRSDLTLGETVVDWDEVTQRTANAVWINEVEPDGFYSLLTETVAQLP
jgi:inosine-uridine nucleoside N-ribohydrolase